MDVERLWQEARPLDAASLPAWLSVDDRGYYRYLRSVSSAGLAPADRELFRKEVEELECLSFVVDPDPADPGVVRVYLAAPQYPDIWSIGVYTGASPVNLGPPPCVQNPVLTREDVSDVPAFFVADPFMVRAGACWHMFFEVLNWRSNKGEIGLATSKDGLHWTYRQIVLSEPFHLSYPYVFEWKNEYYMVPESHQAGAVRLYRATRFPVDWSYVGDMLTGPYLADASLLRYRGRWWLFAETGGSHDTLRIYHAEDLLGPWLEHPMGPAVVGNPHVARPAGRLLETGGRIIRYAQDCHPCYGTAVWAFEITELTRRSYEERPAARDPVLAAGGAGWNARGMHHIDPHRLEQGSWIACVDGWRSRDDEESDRIASNEATGSGKRGHQQL